MNCFITIPYQQVFSAKKQKNDNVIQFRSFVHWDFFCYPKETISSSDPFLRN